MSLSADRLPDHGLGVISAAATSNQELGIRMATEKGADDGRDPEVGDLRRQIEALRVQLRRTEAERAQAQQAASASSIEAERLRGRVAQLEGHIERTKDAPFAAACLGAFGAALLAGALKR